MKKSTEKIFQLKILSLKIIFIIICTGNINAQSFVEEFDTVNWAGGGWPAGWDSINHSTTFGVNLTWDHGPAAGFNAYSGTSVHSDIVAGRWANGTDGGTINAWLLAPTRTFRNGDVIHFYTVSSDSVSGRPDRMQVRLSLNGASSYVGISDTSVGDFTILLIDINPSYSILPYPIGYPIHWHHYILTITSLNGPTPGRFAFRYFVENGLAGNILPHIGTNASSISIDSVAYISSEIIETGIIKINDEEKSCIYPNPFSEQVSVNINSEANYNFNVILENMAGMELININCNKSEINAVLNEAFNNIRNGIYVLKVYSERGEILINQKLIKM